MTLIGLLVFSKLKIKINSVLIVFRDPTKKEINENRKEKKIVQVKNEMEL